MDPTVANLHTLAPGVDYLAWRFINRARTELGFPAVITSGRRTLLQQQRLLAAGRTTTLGSLHLSGRAFDVDAYGWDRDAVPAWAYQELGEMGESMGLSWGGRWISFRDVGHFQI